MTTVQKNEPVESADNERTENKREGQCGFIYYPRFLQKCANIKMFVFIYCLLFMSTSLMLGYRGGTLTTLEKRFRYPSSRTGVLLIANDLAHVALVVIGSHFGGKGHKPRIIAFSLLLVGLGLFISSTPYYIFGANVPDHQGSSRINRMNAMPDQKVSSPVCINYTDEAFLLDDDLVDPSNTDHEDACFKDEQLRSSNNAGFGIIFLGEFVAGCGTAFMFSLGSSYLDDNVDKAEDTPLLLSIPHAARSIGPSLGFLLASATLKRPENLKDTHGLTPRDPGWIGAWWLGFIIIAIPQLLLALPYSMFPRMLPKKEEKENHEESQNKEQQTSDGQLSDGQYSLNNGVVNPSYEETALDVGSKNVETGRDVVLATRKTTSDEKKKPNVLPENESKIIDILKEQPKDLGRALLKLLKNKVYICLVFGNCTDLYTLITAFVFMPKFIEHQYGVSPSEANYTSIAMTAGIMIGMPIAGFILRHFKAQSRGCLFVVILGSIIHALALIISMNLSCYVPPAAGRNQLQTIHGFNLTMSCNQDCNCDRTVYMPVCGSDGLTYFSACYAGCEVPPSGNDTNNGVGMYFNCSCIDGGTATRGKCPQDCDRMRFAYTAVIFITAIGASTIPVSSMIVKLRVVQKELKPLALGFTSFVMSILTFIPAPIVLGAIVDSTCILWQVDKCNKTGACWLYDHDKMRYALHGTAFSFKMASIVIYVIAFFLLKGRLFGGEIVRNPE